mgnify:CR=1 FL=1
MGHHVKPRQGSGQTLYDLPEYYDIAFSWDITREIENLQRCFQKHGASPVRRLLEPACGTGRFLVAFALRGYKLVGYDNNPGMIEYAWRRVAEQGLEDSVEVFVGDMRTAGVGRAFDAAFNPINSLGYLLSDGDVLAHLRNTGNALRKGGVYIVQLNCASEMLGSHRGAWVSERGGTRIRTSWRTVGEDHERKLSHQLCRMKISDHGRELMIQEKHTMRLWLFEDIRELVQRSGVFRLGGIYDEKGRTIPKSTRITGELGNLHYVLVSI